MVYGPLVSEQWGFSSWAKKGQKSFLSLLQGNDTHLYRFSFVYRAKDQFPKTIVLARFLGKQRQKLKHTCNYFITECSSAKQETYGKKISETSFSSYINCWSHKAIIGIHHLIFPPSPSTLDSFILGQLWMVWNSCLVSGPELTTGC